MLLMFKYSLSDVRNAFLSALQSIPFFNQLTATDKGKVVDANFKSMMEDLATDAGFQAGVDYDDNLSEIEPGADFVVYNPEFNQLIKNLMSGKVIAVREHTRVYSDGTTTTVKAHFKTIK